MSRDKAISHSVSLSGYSLLMSILGTLVLWCWFYLQYIKGHRVEMYIVGGAIIILCTAMICYMPLAISVNDRGVRVIRLLRNKDIPFTSIESVCLFRPTMGERRICGSGGWCGYWGRFYDREIGKYFAYYGKASDCFLVVLKDGRKYVLGCKNPGTMVDYIKSHLSK